MSLMEEKAEFDEKVQKLKERDPHKNMIVLKVSPKIVSNGELERSICFSSKSSMYVVHNAIQTAYQLSDSFEHMVCSFFRAYKFSVYHWTWC